METRTSIPNNPTKPLAEIPVTPPTTEVTPPVESPKPKMNKKVLMIVGVVLLLALAGGGYFLWQNSQKQTTSPTPEADDLSRAESRDWKTYTNSDLGFSFKYPNDWKINKRTAGEGSCDGSQIMSPSQKSWINICKVDNADGIGTTVSEKIIIVDGHKGYGYEIDSADSEYGYSFNLENSSERDLLWFLAASDLTEKDKVRNLLNQILSTFKFVDEKTTSIKIPSDWKSFTVQDTDFGVKTTLSAPPGFTFSFTGSETSLSNSETNEGWDYKSSVMLIADGVYGTADGKPKNYYEGGSRREWYTKFFEYINGKGTADKIVGFEDKDENVVSYIEATIEGPRGYPSETKSEKHYIYLQNNIINIFRPMSEAAYKSDATVAKNIASLLYSLKATDLNK